MPPLPCSVDRILRLRRDVFFPGHSIQRARYPGDGASTACHFAGVVRASPGASAERLAACVSILLSEYEGEPAWRARGLAVHPAYRRRGIGSRFLSAVVGRMCRDSRVHLFWCSAPPDVHAFYDALGWRMVDEVYLLQGTGTHFIDTDA